MIEFSDTVSKSNLPLTEKIQLAENWLPRYTGMAIEEFGSYTPNQLPILCAEVR